MGPPVPSQNLRFVVQEHQTADGVHWDLMIQVKTALWTWRMPCPPEQIGDAPLPLNRIADHPTRFLTYEGPVQNNTGSVRIADSGRAEITAQNDHSLTVSFDGKHLKGYVELICTDLEQNNWLFSKKPT